MRFLKLFVAVAAFAALISCSSSSSDTGAAPAAGSGERFTAFAVNPTGGSASLQIVIERWSTEEERQFLLNAFQTGGDAGLLDAIMRLNPRAGYLRGTQTLAYDMQFAAERPLPDGGRRIILATDRPISFFEMKNQTLSKEHAFTLVELRLTPDGKGEGKVVLAADIEVENGVTVIKNYGTQPVRLNSITKAR